MAVARAKGASKKKRAKSTSRTAPGRPKVDPASKYVLFPLFSLRTARPGVYFQIFVWSKAFVRNARWEPLVGVEPQRRVVRPNLVKRFAGHASCEVCARSFIDPFGVPFLQARSCVHVMPRAGQVSITEIPSTFLLKLFYALHAACLHAVRILDISCTCSMCSAGAACTCLRRVLLFSLS